MVHANPLLYKPLSAAAIKAQTAELAVGDKAHTTEHPDHLVRAGCRLSPSLDLLS